MTTASVGINPGLAVLPYNPQSQMPAGTIIAYSGSIASFTSTTSDSTTIIHKDGWAVCNGASLSETTYAQLYARISTTWNTSTNPLTGSAQSAPSSGYFRIPNLQGVFLRAVGDYAGADAYSTDNDVALAAFKVDQMQGHQHLIEDVSGTTKWFAYYGTSRGGAYSGRGYLNGEVDYSAAESTLGAGSLSSDPTNGTPRTGKETNPKQIGVYYLIKLYDNVAAIDVYIPSASASEPGLVNTGTQIIGGVKDFSNGIKLSSGSDVLSVYDEGTFNITVSGPFTSSQTCTIKYTQIGKLVTVYIGQVVEACNSANTVTVIAGQWPAALRPTSSDVAWMFPAYDNGGYPALPTGLWRVLSDGSCIITKDIAGNAWTGASNGGWIRHTASYVI
jgi:hypothetical protein